MSVNEQTLERIRTQLREARDIGGNVPQDLYSHLTEVFNRILLHHSNDAYDKFEEISALVKQTDLKFKDPKFDFEVNADYGEKKVTAEEAWLARSKNLLNEINDLVAEKDRALLSNGKKVVVPDLAGEAEMLEWANISFGEEDQYRLGKAIKRLASMSGAEAIGFVGKIYGTKSDYWIANGRVSSSEEPAEKGVEARGEGTNTFVFWVTDNLLSDWIQLPDCTPAHVNAARKVKHIFTGDLNAEVDVNPTFPGKERHLLRATLARIFAATAIAPKGLFEMNEPEEEGQKPEPKFAEEFVIPGTDELKSLEAWCNLHPNILKVGRTEHVAPEGLDEEAAAEQLAQLEETDKKEERFRAIAEHDKLGDDAAWTSKIIGDNQGYNQIPPKEGTVSYGVNVLRSLRWPGAVTVSKGGKFTSIYVGYGLKRGGATKNPVEPGEVIADPVEPKEEPEPQGKDPAEVKAAEEGQDEDGEDQD